MEKHSTRFRLRVTRETVRELTDSQLPEAGAGAVSLLLCSGGCPTPVINTIPLGQCVSRVCPTIIANTCLNCAQ